jgi:hypothetical protein
MAVVDNSKNSMTLKTQAAELTKQYLVYDAQGRVTDVYTAYTDAKNGQPCSLVQYTYVNATSSRVEKMKESVAVWDSSWDI